MISDWNSIEELADSISASDRAVGWMVYEMCNAARNENWYAALATLFVLVEQVLRWFTSAEAEETLSSILKRMDQEDIITEAEMDSLELLRLYRNKYVHSDFHSNAFIFDDLIYPVNEAETAQVIFENLALSCLQIIYKLTNSPGNQSLR